jgi:LacI family transcriptional regulator
VGGLRRKRSYTVGLVLPCISNETLGGFADQLQRGLLEHQESLIICNTSYDPEMEALEISNLIKQRVDAIVSFPTSDDPTLLREAIQQEIPIVLVDRQIESLPADVVMLNNYSATAEAVRYLVSLGHKKIGYIDRKSVIP